MSRYEVLVLAVPEITQDEAAGLESQLQDTIKKVGSSIISFERWGKYRLAYPVNGNEYGVYFLARFETGQEPIVALEGVKAFLSVDQRNVVMRFITKILDADGSLEYRRPPSLEEMPPKEVGTFTRGENRGGRPEGRGGRFGSHRGPRGPRSDNGFNRKQEYTPADSKNEFDAQQDMINEEIEND